MNLLKTGYAKVNINPRLDTPIYGYFVTRYAKGFLDDLEAAALALSCGGKTILVMTVDHGGIIAEYIAEYCRAIEKATGVAKEDIMISASHTHTGPYIVPDDMFDLNEQDIALITEYKKFLGERLVDVAKLALADMRPTKMGYIVGWAPERVAYIRRYKMKDGSTMTCPPINDPNIDHPIGELDQRVNVLRFDREGTESVVFVNYGLHVDTIGGELISSDWAGWLRRTVEKALDGTKCMVFAGAQGDVGSTHVNPEGGDMNDTEISFDNEMKSPGKARFVGRALAGTVLQVYDKVHYVDVDKVNVLHRVAMIPSNMPKAEDLPLARQYKEWHEAGRDDKIPYEAMELTTVVAEALRMCRLENGPEFFERDIIGVQIGNVVMVGIPGEPFTDVGVAIKKAEGWSMIMPCALTNGNEGYYPMQSAYDEGGYESRSSNYKAGVAEKFIEEGKALLDALRNA